MLYSTEGCHLCEQAHKLLLTVGVEPQIIDIAF
ncbi:glutaredoxin family protein, partial [Vibrio breoganii]